jgi:hypothetical protein
MSVVGSNTWFHLHPVLLSVVRSIHWSHLHPVLLSVVGSYYQQAGELPAATLPGLNGVVTKLDLSMWSGTLNWSRPQTLGPATMAFYPSPTQLLTANAREATTCTYETINPHTTRGITGRGTIVELPACIGQMGMPPLEQPPFVECTCVYVFLFTHFVLYMWI